MSKFVTISHYLSSFVTCYYMSPFATVFVIRYRARIRYENRAEHDIFLRDDVVCSFRYSRTVLSARLGRRDEYTREDCASRLQHHSKFKKEYTLKPFPKERFKPLLWIWFKPTLFEKLKAGSLVSNDVYTPLSWFDLFSRLKAENFQPRLKPERFQVSLKIASNPMLSGFGLTSRLKPERFQIWFTEKFKPSSFRGFVKNPP